MRKTFDLEHDDVARLADEFTNKLDDKLRPNTLSTAARTRDIANLRLNSKMFASFIAAMTFGKTVASIGMIESPAIVGTTGRVCKQIDFSQPWFLYWMQRLRLAPQLHRKLWEDVYVIQCLWERGCLA